MKNVWIELALANTARGKTLEMSFRAKAAQTPPASGVLIVPARAFADRESDVETWLHWANEPGRLLVVVPPFSPVQNTRPVSWQAVKTGAGADDASGLAKILADERRHEIKGRLLDLESQAGQVITAGWQKHPDAGLILITALPLCSLTLMDHPEPCGQWLANHYQRAGRLRAPKAKVKEISGEHWTVLLFLCTGPHNSREAALKALALSDLFEMEAEKAKTALKDLESAGLAQEAQLTKKGERLLRQSPYATYLFNLRRRYAREI